MYIQVVAPLQERTREIKGLCYSITVYFIFEMSIKFTACTRCVNKNIKHKHTIT